MNDLLDLLSGDNVSDSPTVRLGTIPSTYTTGRPTVIFDGEATASSKTYPVFGGYVPAPGDRVALLRSGNGWIVAGKIGDVTPASGTTGNGVYAKLAGDTFTGDVGMSDSKRLFWPATHPTAPKLNLYNSKNWHSIGTQSYHTQYGGYNTTDTNVYEGHKFYTTPGVMAAQIGSGAGNSETGETNSTKSKFFGLVEAQRVLAQSGLSGGQSDKTLRAANADGWDVWFTVRTSAGSYNPYTGADNILLSYSDGKNVTNPRFVIAPWSGSAGGLAIEPNGSVSLASGQYLPDARSTATTPSSYLGQRANMWSFKDGPTIGLTGVSFAAVMGVSPWADDSGGGNHELAFGGDGGMWHRYGTRSGGWGAWERVATNKQPEAWKDVTFLNGFSNWGDTQHNNVQYKKDALGFVHLRGCIKVSSSTPTASAFQLPAGYRPAKGLNFPASAANAFGVWWVYADGNVAPRVTTAGQWMFLDGIRFEAEQ